MTALELADALDKPPFPWIVAHEAARELRRLAAENDNFRTVMVAAAEEIAKHWSAHCDAEGYGPANLMRRLEEGIPAKYGYTAGAFSRLAAEVERLKKPSMTDYPALIRQLLEALEEERRIRILGQSPECGIVHWESIRDLRRRAYENTDVAITAARAAIAALREALNKPQQEPVNEVCWLVELFVPEGNSMGYYHTGFTDLGGNSRTTKSPHEAKRYSNREEAERVAAKLFHLAGVWRAVEHAFATPQPQPAAPQSTDNVWDKPPRHKFWGAGEPDCPADLKAPNGELCDMRCKVCGDGWRKSQDVCLPALRAALATPQPQPAIPQGWQGLTDEERLALIENADGTELSDDEFISAVERALREKNAALSASPTPPQDRVTKEVWKQAAHAALELAKTGSIPPGYALVPLEPTEAMLDAGCEVDARGEAVAQNRERFATLPDHASAGQTLRIQWKAALSASPTPAQPQVQGGWQDIATAPKDGTRILLGFARSHSEEGYWMGDPARNHWGETGWFGCEDDVLCDHPATPDAWQPLPPPPEEKEPTA